MIKLNGSRFTAATPENLKEQPEVQAIAYAVGRQIEKLLAYADGARTYAAIQSVPEGQWEAGYMIGLSSGQIMMRVILPQAARVAFPTLFSSLIGLTKDSSLAASITVVEMFKAAQQIASRTFEPFALYCEAAFVYLMLNTVLTLLQSVLEKRLAWKQPKGNTAQFPPNGLSTAPAAAARHLRCQNAR